MIRKLAKGSIRLTRSGVLIFLCAVLFLGTQCFWIDFLSAQDNFTRLLIDAPKEIYIGEPFAIEVHSALEPDKLKLSWLDKTVSLPIRRTAKGYNTSVMLGTDVDNQDAGKKEVWVLASKSGNSLVRKRVLSIKSKSFPVQRLQLPPSEVSLSEAALERHRREKSRVDKVLDSYNKKRFWSCPFLFPVPGEITSKYGLKRVLNAKPRSPHSGLDFSAKYQSPVQATNTGKVVLTGEHFFAGKSVYIDHGLGVISMYFHLSQIKVSTGQMVEKGEIVGLCGKTGRATASHLHFGISVLGQSVNPLPLLESTHCLDFE